MAFDFRALQAISAAAAEELAIQRLGVEGRGEEMDRRMRRGDAADDTRATPESILDQFRRYTWWFTRDEVLELDPGWRRGSCSTSPTRRSPSSTRSGRDAPGQSTSSAGAWR